MDGELMVKALAKCAAFGAGFFLCALAIGEIGYLLIEDRA